MHYETPICSEKELDRAALALLANFGGRPVAEIHEILRRAGYWLNATTRLDIGKSSEFGKAVSALLHDAQ